MDTEEITLDEYEERCKQQSRTVPIVKAEAVVNIFDKNGDLKSTCEFTTEEMKDAAS